MKKTLALIISIACLSFYPAHSVKALSPLGAMTVPPSKTVNLKYSKEQIFDFILQYKNKQPIPSIALPSLHLKSKTPLKQFQDDIEKQWGLRPKEITNAYVIHLNKIYLMDDADYYQKTGRCLDDSLAHELTHFYQSQYQGYTIDGNDDFFEMDAIEVQTAFREQFCRKP